MSIILSSSQTCHCGISSDNVSKYQLSADIWLTRVKQLHQVYPAYNGTEDMIATKV